ncbi:MAG TPA: hypothetical protein VE891_08010 [Allosphingosinicella sp.]|nr:hypothetical protein [Allosphingosinicella sp.]
MTNTGKRLFATFASSVFLAASALAPTPASAQTGGGGGGGSYCYCQYSHLGGCLPEEIAQCCEYYRYYIIGPPPPECDGYFQPTEEPEESPSEA